MPYESTIEAPIGLFARIRQALFGSPQRTSKFAHPWTAYSPANFQALEKNHRIIERDGRTDRALVVSSCTPIDPSTANALVARPKQDEVIQLVELTPDTTRRTTQRVHRLSAPVTLKLIESQTVETAKTVLPALACASGRDFQLAARLRSISVLNRVSPAHAPKQVVKRSGLNRPTSTVVSQKRLRRVEPPAVRRKTRDTAEIVQLKVALARAELRQDRRYKVA